MKLWRTIVLFLLFSCPPMAFSQTVVWDMQLSDYDEIARIGNNLYKVVRNGKIGLIHSDGTVVADVKNDAIGLFYEHKALVTCHDAQGERVSGCLIDDGHYYGFAGKYYTLNGQKFYSDGLLSVSDENGMLGYIDNFGNPVVGFDGKYGRIKPFTEGYAAVLLKSKNKYVLIGKDGEEVKFQYGGNGIGAAIGGCTNVYGGISYVFDEYGEKEGTFYIYDATSKGKLKKTSRIKNTAKDYLFCYSAVTGRTKEVPFVASKQEGIKGLPASSENGLYGYFSGEDVVLPCQLSAASQFEDGCAIVNLNGRVGILKYIEGRSFSTSVPVSQLSFYAGSSVTCSFVLSMPSVWYGKDVKVVLNGADGKNIPLHKSSNNYSFSVRPMSSSQQDYKLIVYAENLKLYECMLAYSFTKKEKCASCGKDRDKCPFQGNHPSNAPQPQTTKTCVTCGKKLSECKYQGVH